MASATAILGVEVGEKGNLVTYRWLQKELSISSLKAQGFVVFVFVVFFIVLIEFVMQLARSFPLILSSFAKKFFFLFFFFSGSWSNMPKPIVL